ncbi:hypothetical protein BDM02DRAFT_3184893 [Thelephora ganbajun]|uniref:Uncharacterized protein n=1 Tax=Thelephora ganbajun TaxID=370292 RepID=A0ACB6ZNG1_THEGA|nr:hypothetical protein BDM02DRAFT_3184893 [Thelephora ganbajun]
MAYILLYRGWDILWTDRVLNEDVTCFIKYTLSRHPPPSTAIVADFLLTIGLILGIGIYVDDFLVDKSRAVHPQISRICRLTAILQRSEATDYEIDRALQNDLVTSSPSSITTPS